MVQNIARIANIWLSPSKDFHARASNLITITPSDNNYELYDVNLYDEDGRVYDEMANVAAEARRNLAILHHLPYAKMAELSSQNPS